MYIKLKLFKPNMPKGCQYKWTTICRKLKWITKIKRGMQCDVSISEQQFEEN